IHIVGARQELGRVATSGRPRLAPHSLVQEYLNRTEHLWGIVTNGLTLRLLRNSTFVRRQAYVEFDLVAILEESRFQDFAELYRQLLRLVYRLLFLLVSEDRGLLSADPIYREHYSIGRLRRLLENHAASTEYDDLWQSLRVLWKVLSDEKFAAFLKLAPLNG